MMLSVKHAGLNYATWRNNPQFSMEVEKETEATIFLSLDTDMEGMTPGFYIVNAPENTALCVDLTPEKIKIKGPFREGLESTPLHSLFISTNFLFNLRFYSSRSLNDLAR